MKDLPVRVRWMISSDSPQVTQILDWDEEVLLAMLRQRDVIGMVAEISEYEKDAGRVVGAVVYQLLEREILIIRIAVAKDVRRRGIGVQILLHLRRKITQGVRRYRIIANINPGDLRGAMFFRGLNYRYSPGDDDNHGNYRMVCVVPDCRNRSKYT